MSQPRVPPPWPPRPIYLAHFLHPPGGSLHYSVPESVVELLAQWAGLWCAPVSVRNARCMLAPMVVTHGGLEENAHCNY